MIVHNTGYVNKEQVLKLISNKIKFGIYETNRGTQVLVVRPEHLENKFYPFTLYTHDESRKEWKLTEDRRILDCQKLIFDHNSDPESLDTSKWNNSNQIITYHFVYYLLSYWFDNEREIIFNK